MDCLRSLPVESSAGRGLGLAPLHRWSRVGCAKTRETAAITRVWGSPAQPPPLLPASQSSAVAQQSPQLQHRELLPGECRPCRRSAPAAGGDTGGVGWERASRTPPWPASMARHASSNHPGPSLVRSPALRFALYAVLRMAIQYRDAPFIHVTWRLVARVLCVLIFIRRIEWERPIESTACSSQSCIGYREKGISIAKLMSRRQH